jgi:hypothetical protein
MYYGPCLYKWLTTLGKRKACPCCNEGVECLAQVSSSTLFLSLCFNMLKSVLAADSHSLSSQRHTEWEAEHLAVESPPASIPSSPHAGTASTAAGTVSPGIKSQRAVQYYRPKRPRPGVTVPRAACTEATTRAGAMAASTAAAAAAAQRLQLAHRPARGSPRAAGPLADPRRPGRRCGRQERPHRAYLDARCHGCSPPAGQQTMKLVLKLSELASDSA